MWTSPKTSDCIICIVMLEDYLTTIYVSVIGLIIILTWIVETDWFWVMIGLNKKKKKTEDKRTGVNWYGEPYNKSMRRR